MRRRPRPALQGERFELVLVVTSNADTLLNPTLVLALANSPDQVQLRRASVVSSAGGVVVTAGYVLRPRT